MKKIISMILCIGMVLTLAACGGKEDFDAEKYVMGVMDTAYHCETDGYAKQTGVKKTEAQEKHLEFTKKCGIRLAAYFGIETTEDSVREYQDICERLFQKAHYAVSEVKEENGDFKVSMNLEEFHFISDVEEQSEKLRAQYQKALASGEENALENYETGLLEIMDTCVESAGSESGEMTVSGTITLKEKDGKFSADGDFEKINEEMFGF